MIQDNRQFQIEALLSKLTFGANTQGSFNTTALTYEQTHALGHAISHIWAYVQEREEPTDTVAGIWGLLSLQFPGRNGSVLFREFSRIHKQLLEERNAHSKQFTLELLKLIGPGTVEDFSRKCRMLGLNEHVLLESYSAQMVKEETITITRQDTFMPYIGEPLFEEEYLSEPGSLYNDLLSAFTIKEYKHFEEHMSLHQENCSEQVQPMDWMDSEGEKHKSRQQKRKMKSLEPISEDEYQISVVSPQDKKTRIRHNRPSNRRLKLRLLEYEQQQRMETNSETFKKKLQRRRKAQSKEAKQPKQSKSKRKPKPKPKSDRSNSRIAAEMEEQEEFSVRRKKLRRYMQYVDSEEESDQPASRNLIVDDAPDQRQKPQRAHHLQPPKKKRFELYRVRRLECDYQDFSPTYSQPVQELLTFAQCQQKQLTRPQRLSPLTVRLAFIYFSRNQIKPDDLALVTAAYDFYTAAQSNGMEGLAAQLSDMLATMMHSCFVKMVATLTNVLTGAFEEELALSILIMTEFNRIAGIEESLRPSLTIGECVSKFINDLLDSKDSSENSAFYERSNFKQVYAVCCESEQHSRFAPLNLSVVVSIRFAELLLTEKGLFKHQQTPVYRKKLMMQYKRCLEHLASSHNSLLEFWMQLDSLYPRGLCFEEWEVMFSFAEPPPEQQTALSSVDASFTSTSLRRYLEDQLNRTKNYKNILNKVLKQTFLVKVKSRPTRPLVECYSSTVSALLDNELFRNAFVYREVLSGLDTKKLVECGRGYQQLLLRILKYSANTNQSQCVKTLSEKQQLMLSAGSEDCFKGLLSWLNSLFSVLEDDVRHLSIAKHPELIEKVKEEVRLICELFRGMFVDLNEEGSSYVPVELWIIRYRLLLEEPHLAGIFKKADEEYIELKLQLIDKVIGHLTMPLNLVDLSEHSSGSAMDEEKELILLHQHMKLAKVLEESLKELLKASWNKTPHVLDYKAAPAKTNKPALLEKELQLMGVLFGFRLWSGRTTLEEVDRYISPLIDRNFNIYNEAFGRLAGLECVVKIYWNMLGLLLGFSTRMPFGEPSLKLFFQCVINFEIILPEESSRQSNLTDRLLSVLPETRQVTLGISNNLWSRVAQNLRGRQLGVGSVVTVAAQLDHCETELEELMRLLERNFKSLREFYKEKQLGKSLSTAATNFLRLFSILLSSRKNLNKSIEVLTQMFRARDSEQLNMNSLLLVCVSDNLLNYATLLEFLERLDEYPTNIYKVKSIREQYVRWVAANYNQFVTVKFSGVPYEELLAMRPIDAESEMEIFLHSVVAYCRARTTPNTLKFSKRLVEELLQTLWTIQKGIDQHKQLLTLKVLTLAWLKMRIPELSSVLEEFAFNNLNDIVSLLLSIPYECQSAQWLLRGPLLAANNHSDKQILGRCFEELHRLKVREDPVKLELE